MSAYYNEFDPKAAAWLRELIKRGLVADGEVDERSITDVAPDDLVGFSQCHFFAGIGVWSYALRQAGWADDRPAWTGSCPCQPFSSAGQGRGTDDERHLWPAWRDLIKARQPTIVFGEQVASAAVLGKVDGSAPRGPDGEEQPAWFDAVSADLEAAHYACGAADIPAAGFGAPHIRQRLYFVAQRLADTDDQREGSAGNRARIGDATRTGEAGGLVHGVGPGLEGLAGHGNGGDQPGRLEAIEGRSAPETSSARGLADAKGERWNGREDTTRSTGWLGAEIGGDVERLADADGGNAGAEREQRGGQYRPESQDVGAIRSAGGGTQSGFAAGLARPGPVNGFWRDADWIGCRDGKWRPVGPGTFPLAHGASARVGRLRGYGNAINAAQAQAFIESVMEATAVSVDRGRGAA